MSSKQDLAVVRRALDLLRESHERGAASDDLIGLCAPDVRVDATHRVFNPAVYDGAAGLRRAIQEIADAWEGFRESNERVLDAGDRLVVIQTIRGRGRVSNALVEQKGALVFTVREGLVRRVEVFTDPRTALQTTGLKA